MSVMACSPIPVAPMPAGPFDDLPALILKGVGATFMAPSGAINRAPTPGQGLPQRTARMRAQTFGMTRLDGGRWVRA